MPSGKWENDVAASHQKDVRGNRVSGKRVCKYCNRKFSNGRALGGHIRTHNTTKFSTNKTQRRYSSSPPHTTTNYCLSGWKVHKRRGSNQVKRSKETQDGGNNSIRDKEVETIEKSQEKETDQDSSSDGDDKGFSMMERLKEFDSNHKISRTRNRYVCLTCNIIFPTFHGVRCHVYQSLSSPANNADEDAEADKFAEEYENSGSINQAVVTSNHPGMLDFDLNELPPMEEEE